MEATLKEFCAKPILFSAPMIRAILDGRKSVTRRIVKPQPPERLHAIYARFPNQEGGPYRVGQTLWVRENFYVMPDMWAKDHGPQPIHYAADVADRNQVEDYACKPSIHMPRWASRLTLLVKSVRVERVQDITHADAIAEGVAYDVSKPDGTPLPRFAQLWDSIHGPGAWKRSDWVWVIGFERVKA